MRTSEDIFEYLGHSTCYTRKDDHTQTKQSKCDVSLINVKNKFFAAQSLSHTCRAEQNKTLCKRVADLPIHFYRYLMLNQGTDYRQKSGH